MLEIEIVESNLIEGGLEIFARIFENGNQVGFGKDGSIDLERFVIINPPLLVADDNGIHEIPYTVEDIDGNVTESGVRKYREDPVEALLQTIESTYKTMTQKHGSERIVAGKRGNTTTTVYSDAGGDGDITSGGGSVTFSDARNGTSLGVDKVDNDGNCYIDTSVFMRRLFLPFDTSSIASGDTINSATLTVTHPNLNQVDTDGISFNITESGQASLTNLVTTDWENNATVDDTVLSSAIVNSAFAGANTTNDFVLNATGEGRIAKGSGFTKLVMRTVPDINNSSSGVTGGNYVDIYYSDETGTTRDPKLVVEHEGSAVGAVNPTLLTLGVG